MNQRRRNVLPLNKVKVDDFFWNKYTRLVTDQIIPYQWEALNDRVEDAEPSHCIKNFEIAAGLREGCAYRGDLKNTLCAAARTAAAFVAREPKFSALFVALYHSAKGNDAYKAVRPLVFRLQRQIEEIFIDASADLGNMHGRQRQFSLGFIGLVLYYIVMKQETSKREDVQITEAEIEALVHQFMHGIYS